MDCNPLGSSVHGILQERILEWVALPFSRNLPNWGIKPRSPLLQADSLQSEPPGKPIELNTSLLFLKATSGLRCLCGLWDLLSSLTSDWTQICIFKNGLSSLKYWWLKRLWNCRVISVKVTCIQAAATLWLAGASVLWGTAKFFLVRGTERRKGMSFYAIKFFIEKVTHQLTICLSGIVELRWVEEVS